MQKDHKSVYIQCAHSAIHQMSEFIALKNTDNSTIGGVGMILSPHATKSLNSIEKITSRILVATFHGYPEPTLISC